MEQADNTTDRSHQTWMVYRQDDHGNRFVVASDLSRETAEHLIALYEQRGHKQHYWAEDKKDE
ncbi:MAG: hypothetical protein JWP89_3497 [Schlesneria sp.]|nr:hypothetical protein [Schlesneria sp.]